MTAPAEVITGDDLRVEYPDGFGLHSGASNTTPVIVLRFGADNAEALARIRRISPGDRRQNPRRAAVLVCPDRPDAALARGFTEVFMCFDQSRRPVVTVRDLLRCRQPLCRSQAELYGRSGDNAYDGVIGSGFTPLKLPLDRLEPFLDARLVDENPPGAGCCWRAASACTRPPTWPAKPGGETASFRWLDERVIVRVLSCARAAARALEHVVGIPARLVHALPRWTYCTGSGCLAVLLAVPPGCRHWTRVDLSADALAVAADQCRTIRPAGASS